MTDRLLIIYGNLPRQIFFVAGVLYCGSWDFLYGRCKQLFVSELMLISPDIYFKTCLSGYVLHNSLLHLHLKNGDFLNTDISQESVATRLGYVGGNYISLCYKFPTESNSERIVNISKYLVKFMGKS